MIIKIRRSEMRKAIIIMILSILAACGYKYDSQPKFPPTGVVKGVVVRDSNALQSGSLVAKVLTYLAGEDQQPIKGARVRIAGTNLVAESGPGGIFHFSNIPNGTHTILIDFDEDGDGVAEWKVEFKNFTLEQGKGVALGKCLLEKTGEINGTVIAEGYKGSLQGIKVFIPGTESSTFTDEKGNYLLSWVAKGTYKLAAVVSFIDYNGYGVNSKVVVDPGKVSIGNNINVKKSTLKGTILGKVIPYGISSWDGTKVTLNTGIEAGTDPKGFYIIKGVPVGIYTLTARREGYVPVNMRNILVLPDPNAFEVESIGLFTLNTIVASAQNLDPSKIDSDGDGFTDKEEKEMGSDPVDPNSYPTVPPTAVAGKDKSVNLGETVFFDGSASYSKNGNPIIFLWSIRNAPSRSTAAVSNIRYPKPTLKPDVSGEYVIRLVVNDGKADSTPSEFKITAISTDTLPPDTTIVSMPPPATNLTSAIISFVSTKANSSFECCSDSNCPNNWNACSSPVIFTGLKEVSHLFSVRAIDPSGNVDPSPSSVAWIVDLIPPQTPGLGTGAGKVTISQNPPGSSDIITGVVGAVEANAWVIGYSDLNLTKEIARTQAGSDGSLSGIDIGDNKNGAIYIVVQDQAGNRSAALSGLNDIVAPYSWFTGVPSSYPSNITSPTFTFVSNETNAVFQCKLDAGGYATCTSPATFTSLSNGDHLLTVKATDVAGNYDTTPVTFSWTIAAVIPPDTNITSSPANPTNSTSA
jgi:hypothetical protein